VLKILITIEQMGVEERLRVQMESIDETDPTKTELLFAELARRMVKHAIATLAAEAAREAERDADHPTH
jgi:hypothetical protein